MYNVSRLRVNAARPIINILYWLRETEMFTVQYLENVDDNDGVYLTTACYTMEDYRKDYECMNWIIPAHNMVHWWAFVFGSEPAVRILYTIELQNTM
jgi:hypothetical protein